MSSVQKRHGRKKTLRGLHNALKKLATQARAQDAPAKQPERPSTPAQAQTGVVDSTELVEAQESPQNGDSRSSTGDEAEEFVEERNGVIYIMSKERQPIPKLTDEEVMKRHKRADENMKEVWARLIEKYESMQDEGDVIDLNSGEIVEDNGHVRGLASNENHYADEDRYISVLSDLLDVDTTQNNVWGEEQESDGGEEDEEDTDYDHRQAEDDDTSEDEDEDTNEEKEWD
ncbi:LAMI_0E11628g1_1 [Lachancea mirantina]|uniref:LAMI_0E11628g1_1 n=1 Tax=Lachancea mirantina TaxID=1230905 RepID=A0A1G4JQ21_9SACH|nr:LAMI_0E11628g1_1 [Lachancea mirantina]